MNLASLDLNLLVALDALLNEAHVGRAAHRVGLSQPAMSHTLKRIRDVVRDPLLVRTHGAMELTSRAQSLRAPVATILDQVRGLFASDAFEPARSERRFRLMMPDLVVDLLLAPLVKRVAVEAPGVRLEVMPWHGPAVLTREHARSIDLVIACLGDAFPGFLRQRLYRDGDALAVAKQRTHPARLSKLDGFLAARHVAVIGHGSNEDLIDAWLRREGHARDVAVITPSYLQALHVAARSDLVAFVPRRLIASASKSLGLRLVEPPLDPGIDEQSLYYPVRAELDPASIWLRRCILDVGRELEGRDRPGSRGR